MSRRMTLTLHPELRRRLQKVAASEGVSVPDAIRLLLLRVVSPAERKARRPLAG